MRPPVLMGLFVNVTPCVCSLQELPLVFCFNLKKDVLTYFIFRVPVFSPNKNGSGSTSRLAQKKIASNVDRRLVGSVRIDRFGYNGSLAIML